MNTIEMRMNAVRQDEITWLYSVEDYEELRESEPDAKIVWSLYLMVSNQPDSDGTTRACWIADYEHRSTAESIASSLASAPIGCSYMHISKELNDLTNPANKEYKS